MNLIFRNTKGIIKRELISYFSAPFFYLVIVIYLFLCGFFTFYIDQFYEVGQADLRGFFQYQPWIFLFLIPAVAMRLWAEERHTGTLELTLTLPITLTEVILGKFIAAWVFIGLALFLTFPLVLTVVYLGNPDLGAIFCAYFGSFLMAGAYLSVGSMTSSLTRNQIISFILSGIICLFLTMAGWQPIVDILSGWAPLWVLDIVSGFSLMSHFESMKRGVLDVRDLAYYVTIIFFMLFITGVILKKRRAS